ncbi:DUF5658 family protein [Planctomicrobium sp. SH668]|uniref:DUF5658 family protein n=1 Tax=Planctomicrobium sp. SH668 TaxID=3448126 RepID=UPI003F5B2F95
MSEARSDSSPRKKDQSFYYRLFHMQLPLETESTVFILVNLLDFFATYFGLANGVFRESNPIANWFLEGWGVKKGLLIYKLVMVTLVCVIAQIVYPHRPRTARMILIGGSLVVGYVVIYSVRLLLAQELF